MKEVTIGILVIVLCVALRFLVDYLDKPEETTLATIENIETKNFLVKSETFLVEQNVKKVGLDSSLFTSDAEINIQNEQDGTIKLSYSSTNSDQVPSIFDNLNIILKEKEKGFQIQNREMLIRQIHNHFDTYQFQNFDKPFPNEIDSLSQSKRLVDDIFLRDSKLHALAIFQNRQLNDEAIVDTLNLSSMGNVLAIQSIKMEEGTDSLNVTLTSKTTLNSKDYYLDTLSYNLKTGKLNKLTQWKPLGDSFVLQ